MKIYIIGNNSKDNNNLSDWLSKIYDLKNFNIDDLNDEKKLQTINKIIKENKEWVIDTKPDPISNIIAANATTIIYLNIQKKKFLQKDENLISDSKETVEFLKKHSSKIIILKNKKEIKALQDAIYKGIEL